MISESFDVFTILPRRLHWVPSRARHWWLKEVQDMLYDPWPCQIDGALAEVSMDSARSVRCSSSHHQEYTPQN